MYLGLAQRVRQRIKDDVRERFAVELDAVSVELPPRTQLGDMAVPVAFELARRRLGKPRELAEALRGGLESLAEVARVELAGAGYLNLFLDRAAAFRSLHREVAEGRRPSEVARPGKTVVEHTNINPNKAAHIGHLRNAVLGDSLVRMLRYVGESVEVQNYIDDTGVQVADVVVGFEDLERLELEQVRELPEPFDHACWDLYARVGRYYAEDEARLARRSQVLKAVEEGGNTTAELANHVANRVVRRHLATMDRIGVHYDLLAWEGDVLRTDLWSHAFARLRQTEAVHRAESGKNAGCWVMRLAGAEGFEDLEEPDKVLVRSDGTATYVAKDIAYQMWKFGLLGVDFNYRRLDGSELWSTTSQPGEKPPEPFGGADRVVNVIDTRQSYLQAIVAEGLRALGHSEQADRSIHFSYEMVALTPACAAELGIELSAEDQGRPFVEMSGRKGLGIKADDLMDKLCELAMAEVAERHPELDAGALGRLADAIAMGSLRYFMLRFSRNKVVAFDFKEALNFRGETGAYLQNAVVRARSIFRKLAQQEGRDLSDPRAFDPERDLTDTSELESEDDLWDLVLGLSRLDDVLQAALSQLELSVLARYAFQMAQKFHRVYDRYRVLGQPPGPRRLARAAVISLYLARMTEVLDLMGIQVPERM